MHSHIFTHSYYLHAHTYEVKSLSPVQLFVTPWAVAYKAPLSMEFSRQEYWSGLPFPSPGDLPNSGIEPGSPALQAVTLPSEPPGYPLRLLLLLSHFSRVQLCATPSTAAHQAPPPLGFSRQEHWSGLPFPSPMHESEVAQSCPTLSDPMDCSLPGSSVHGISQARVLEWVAITFSSP